MYSPTIEFNKLLYFGGYRFSWKVMAFIEFIYENKYLLEIHEIPSRKLIK